jgi:hypothetical protein
VQKLDARDVLVVPDMLNVSVQHNTIGFWANRRSGRQAFAELVVRLWCGWGSGEFVTDAVCVR